MSGMTLAFLLDITQLDGTRAATWILIAVLAGLVVHRIVHWLFSRWSRLQGGTLASAIVRRLARPSAYIFPLLAVMVVVPNLTLPASWKHPLFHTVGLLAIAGIGWAMVALVRLWGDVVVARHRIDVEDNLLARQLGTRVDILARTATTLVVLIAIGMMLMTFPEIRALGTTILASAGVVGIVGGLAARPLFENLVAGIQLALTQPIRLDDVVIVAGQYGKIEEIHSTYIVVQLWDLRRLVVPLTYFLENPIENWTRRTANLMGEVYVYADWSLDVDALRAEIPKIVARSPLWDSKFENCQVTDVTERAIQIRALVTARNSGELFDLRCFVREEIVKFIREKQPAAMPKLRVEVPSGQLEAERQEPRAQLQERLLRAVATADSQKQAATPG
jgi:small-conductance mechanosensitive channel